jgi:serine/threonine protein kinase
VYAFGCVFFEMLFGSPPLSRLAQTTAVGRDVRDLPSVRSYRSEAHVPEATDEIIRTCLARVPADRYLSGSELLRSLLSAIK